LIFETMNIKIIAILSLVAFFCSSCGKFRDAKSDKKLAVPVTLDDLQSILNYQNTFDKSAEELEIPSGDFDLTDEDLDMLSCETTWDLYLWQDGPHVSRCEGDMGWEKAYKQVYNANAVMEGVMKYLKSNPPNTQANNILG